MRALRDICKEAGQEFLGGIGASKIKATGDAYHLTRILYLADVYGQVRLSWALADRGNGRLRTKRQGLMLTAGAVRIQLR